MKTPNTGDPLPYALNLFSRKSYTKKEIIKKLKSKLFPEDKIEECISRLIELSYIDDLKYGERYVEYLKEKKMSPFKIKQKLFEKGIGRETVQNLNLEEMTSSDYEGESCLILARKKIKSLSKITDPYEKKQKLYRFLASRGFSTATIKETIGKILNEEIETEE